MKYFTLFFLSLMTFAEERPVVLKKNMFITCPANHRPIYRISKTIREGESINSDMVLDLETGKKPKPGERFKCDSVYMTYRGACIHTNKGWLPKVCQVGLRVSLDFETIIEKPKKD